MYPNIRMKYNEHIVYNILYILYTYQLRTFFCKNTWQLKLGRAYFQTAVDLPRCRRHALFHVGIVGAMAEGGTLRCALTQRIVDLNLGFCAPNKLGVVYPVYLLWTNPDGDVPKDCGWTMKVMVVAVDGLWLAAANAETRMTIHDSR